MNRKDQKYYQKSESISSAEPNYLSQFEMRYPVQFLYTAFRFDTDFKIIDFLKKSL